MYKIVKDSGQEMKNYILLIILLIISIYIILKIIEIVVVYIS